MDACSCGSACDCKCGCSKLASCQCGPKCGCPCACSSPASLAADLRKIASKIEASVKPSRSLVVQDLRSILRRLGE